MDWFEQERAALLRQRDEGHISYEEYMTQLVLLRRDHGREQDEMGIRNAGRVHLLRG